MVRTPSLPSAVVAAATASKSPVPPAGVSPRNAVRTAARLVVGVTCPVGLSLKVISPTSTSRGTELR